VVVVKQVAIGFRVHSGWSAVVAVSLEEAGPQVLVRRRANLVETFTYTFRQPYHTAKRMPAGEASAFISKMQAEALRLARETIRSMQAEVEQQGYGLDGCALLLASGKPLPGLEKILASHALIHTADGGLFREAILGASKSCGLPVFAMKERELLDAASTSLRLKKDAIGRRLAALGKGCGAPWSQDEKFAALAAWLSLRQPKKS
jgi:hypothetical protein